MIGPGVQTAWGSDGILADSPIVHLFDDNPRVALCGAEITELAGEDDEPVCVVCAAIDEQSREVEA